MRVVLQKLIEECNGHEGGGPAQAQIDIHDNTLLQTAIHLSSSREEAPVEPSPIALRNNQSKLTNQYNRCNSPLRAGDGNIPFIRKSATAASRTRNAMINNPLMMCR